MSYREPAIIKEISPGWPIFVLAAIASIILWVAIVGMVNLNKPRRPVIVPPHQITFEPNKAIGTRILLESIGPVMARA
jgi:hypothetical protein